MLLSVKELLPLSKREQQEFFARNHYLGKAASGTEYAWGWPLREQLEVAISFGVPVSRNWRPRAPGVVELTRLAKTEDSLLYLSTFVSAALRIVTKKSPFILSYADWTQRHHGGIYQATNFAYVGARPSRHVGWRTDTGEYLHCRTCNGRYGTSGVAKLTTIFPSWTPVFGKEKHLYVYPGQWRLKKILQVFSLSVYPYPKPDASRPSDDEVPTSLSRVQPPGDAPISMAPGC